MADLRSRRALVAATGLSCLVVGVLVVAATTAQAGSVATTKAPLTATGLALIKLQVRSAIKHEEVAIHDLSVLPRAVHNAEANVSESMQELKAATDSLLSHAVPSIGPFDELIGAYSGDGEAKNELENDYPVLARRFLEHDVPKKMAALNTLDHWTVTGGGGTGLEACGFLISQNPTATQVGMQEYEAGQAGATGAVVVSPSSGTPQSKTFVLGPTGGAAETFSLPPTTALSVKVSLATKNGQSQSLSFTLTLSATPASSCTPSTTGH